MEKKDKEKQLASNSEKGNLIETQMNIEAVETKKSVELEDVLKIIGILYLLTGVIAIFVIATSISGLIDWVRFWRISLLIVPVVISSILLFFVPAEIILLMRANNKELKRIASKTQE